MIETKYLNIEEMYVESLKEDIENLASDALRIFLNVKKDDIIRIENYFKRDYNVL